MSCQTTKRRNKQMYKEHLAKKNDDGYRYPNCPVCWKEQKVSQCEYGEDGSFTCNTCNAKWTVVA